MTFCSIISVFKGILLNLSIIYCNFSLVLICLFGIAVYVLFGGKNFLPKIEIVLKEITLCKSNLNHCCTVVLYC